MNIKHLILIKRQEPANMSLRMKRIRQNAYAATKWMSIVATFALLCGSMQNASAQTSVANDDCETLKELIKALQDHLASLSAAAKATTDALERTKQDFEKADKALQDWNNSEAIKKVLKSSAFSEEFKGELLEKKRQILEHRRNIRNNIDRLTKQSEDLNREIEATKAAIDSLLNALANCGQKTAGSPTPTPSPSSTPSKKKKKHTDHQTSYVPPPPTTPSTTDKVVDVLKTIGGSVSIGVGGGTSGGGGGGHRHDRARGQDRTRTAEKTKTGNKPHTTSKQPPSTHKTVTAGCKCHPCTCSPCTCH